MKTLVVYEDTKQLGMESTFCSVDAFKVLTNYGSTYNNHVRELFRTLFNKLKSKQLTKFQRCNVIIAIYHSREDASLGKLSNADEFILDFQADWDLFEPLDIDPMISEFKNRVFRLNQLSQLLDMGLLKYLIETGLKSHGSKELDNFFESIEPEISKMETRMSEIKRQFKEIETPADYESEIKKLEDKKLSDEDLKKAKSVWSAHLRKQIN